VATRARHRVLDEQYLVFAEYCRPHVYLWSYGFRLASEVGPDVLWVHPRAFSHELGNQLPQEIIPLEIVGVLRVVEAVLGDGLHRL
jgi:hypothetical protein